MAEWATWITKPSNQTKGERKISEASGFPISTTLVIMSRVRVPLGLPPACGVSGGDLEDVARFELAGRLTLHRPQCYLCNVTGLDPRVSMPRHSYSRLDYRLHDKGMIAWRRAVHLGQDFSRHTGCRARRRVLRRHFGRNETSCRADCAGRGGREATSLRRVALRYRMVANHIASWMVDQELSSTQPPGLSSKVQPLADFQNAPGPMKQS